MKHSQKTNNMHLENTVGEFPFHADSKQLAANSAILSATFFFLF